MLSHSSRLLIIGDWISQYTYVVFDGKTLTMHNYLEGGNNK
jgi:UDP-2,3-diacylglucosamine hydrolase